MRNFNLPALGGGAGLRNEHFEEILETRPPFNWFEVISENVMGFGGWVREAFQEIRKQYRIIPHGVCMSIGSTDPLNLTYLKNLRAFCDELDAPWTSDHLCFTMVDHTNLNELIPLPFTKECAENIIDRVKKVQDLLGRPFLLENVTRYLTISDREMSESEFISTIAEKADCGILLDVTNVHLNSLFHGYDAYEFIRSLPLDRVGQMHLAGWESDDGQIIDSHDAPVPPEVWELFRKTLELTGPSSVLVEWDAQLPNVQRLLEETVMADRLIEEVCGRPEERVAACR
ncbi:MAG: DUF692 domain-containing protein [Bdellovibrionota bacterium]